MVRLVGGPCQTRVLDSDSRLVMGPQAPLASVRGDARRPCLSRSSASHHTRPRLGVACIAQFRVGCHLCLSAASGVGYFGFPSPRAARPPFPPRLGVACIAQFRVGVICACRRPAASVIRRQWPPGHLVYRVVAVLMSSSPRTQIVRDPSTSVLTAGPNPTGPA